MLKYKNKIKIHVLWLIFIVSITFAFVLNLPVLSHMNEILAGIPTVKLGFIVSMPFLLVAALNFVFIPLSFKPILKPVFVFLFITGSMASYAALNYGVIFDHAMIGSLAESNVHELSTYLTPGFFFWFAVTGLLPSALLLLVGVNYPKTTLRSLSLRSVSMLVSLGVILVVAALYTKDYVSVGRNNPSLAHEILPANYIASTIKYINRTYLQGSKEFGKFPAGAVRKSLAKKPTLMFLAIGETARAQNFAWNGYPRDTTPFTLASIGDELISFRNVRSCGTSTNVSVPCMFSNMTKADFNEQRARNSENVLDLLQHTGVSTFWIENDGGCKGVCKRIPNIEIRPDNPKFCNGDTCFDEVMLEDIDKIIEDMPGDKLIAFHMIGSHGPTYSLRYPTAHEYFVPDCPRKDIENCTQEQLVNTYDNTIRYTDYVLSLMLEKLKEYSKDYNTALLYISDHGESLGEKGLYLHGAPYMFAPDEQTLVPFAVWLSPDLLKAESIDLACLQKESRRGKFSHDNLFSSLLGLWNVETPVYNKKLDLFSPCRNNG